MYYSVTRTDELQHHGVKGQKWGVRRYQNADGTYTSAGKKRRREKKLYNERYGVEKKAYHDAKAKVRNIRKGVRSGENTRAELNKAKYEKSKAADAYNEAYSKGQKTSLLDYKKNTNAFQRFGDSLISYKGRNISIQTYVLDSLNHDKDLTVGKARKDAWTSTGKTFAAEAIAIAGTIALADLAIRYRPWERIGVIKPDFVEIDPIKPITEVTRLLGG